MINKTEPKGSEELKTTQIEEVMTNLITSLGKLISLEFLKQSAAQEIKVIFLSAWNLAYEAKERGLLH
jgi:hypothetical protein